MKMPEGFFLTTERFGNAGFFRRPAFRSWYIVADTILVILVLLMGIVLLTRGWRRFPLMDAAWLVMGILWMTMLWARVLEDHSKMRDVVARSSTGQLSPENTLERTLSISASTVQLGHFFAVMAIASTVAALGDVMLFRR